VTAAEAILGNPSPLDGEDEEVAGVIARSVEQRVEQLALLRPPLDVHVFRAARPRGQAQVEGEAPLQEPSSLGNFEETGE
jgi:hypothetical protein